MTNKYLVLIAFLLMIVFVGCNFEYNCFDGSINPVFVGFDSSDIDTVIIRRFKPNTNYQNLIDTFIVTTANLIYSTSNDSTTIFLYDDAQLNNDIKVDYDWQIFIPAKQRTTLVSDIKSEKLTGERSRFLEPVGGLCSNRIFSVKVDNQLISFTDYEPYIIYINK